MKIWPGSTARCTSLCGSFWTGWRPFWGTSGRIRELYPHIGRGFQEIKVGSIPAAVDQVMVGDITRSRLEDVKVLFFVGGE